MSLFSKHKNRFTMTSAAYIRLCASFIILSCLFSGCSMDPADFRSQQFLHDAAENEMIGKSAEAKKQMDEAIGETPKLIDPYLEPAPNTNEYSIAEILTASGNDTLLAAYMREAHNKFPDSDKPLAVLVECDLRLGDSAALHTDALALIALVEQKLQRPKTVASVETYGNLAIAYFYAGNVAAGKSIFDRALAAYPNNPDLLNEYAYTVADTQDVPDYAKAETDAQASLQAEVKAHGPDTPVAGLIQDTLGWVRFRRGNLGDARFDLQSATSNFPSSPELHFHLGTVYLAAGDKAAAIASFQRAHNLNPTYAGPNLALKGLDALPHP